MKKILLDCFFKPESVVVIGASEKEGSVGSILVQNLVRGGFPGASFPLTKITRRFMVLPPRPPSPPCRPRQTLPL